jgi:hypothetical protein
VIKLFPKIGVHLEFYMSGWSHLDSTAGMHTALFIRNINSPFFFQYRFNGRLLKTGHQSDTV